MSGRTYVYYDAGMLIDDDDKIYVAFGNPNMNVAELSADTMNSSWEFFLAYRFGIFNFATKALGGSVTMKSFDVETP